MNTPNDTPNGNPNQAGLSDLSGLSIRPATEADLPAIVAMLADDPLGATRESPDDLTPYRTALKRLVDDPHQHLVVAVRAERVVGTLQLTIVPGLSRKGSTRSIIEGVRVHADERGSGLGTRFIEWAIEKSRAENCDLVQLTSDATRTDAHRFYERLGFAASHVGFKMQL
ncbi:GNAT family N-acetyltransferase [Streptomyces sp. NPDC085524]|uniref:GNAT family N-acetyltransferase n=1 Tax=unclassified Streptomyces TaxID=2593676 RepID=UPI0035E0DB55